MTIEDRRKQIRYAIKQVERAERCWHEAEQNPSCGTRARSVRKALFQDAEQKFGWQWRNVRAVLDAETTIED